MLEPSDLTRKLQEFTDTLRSLTPERLSAEERATLRAALVELSWLVRQSESDG